MDLPAVKPKRQGSPSIKIEEPIQNKRTKHASSASEHDQGSYSGSAHVATCKNCGHVVEIPNVAPHIE